MLGCDPVSAKECFVPAGVYARAEALLGANLEAKVRNVFVVPHWLGNGTDEFWYRRELADGCEFVVVNAADGRRRPAFDHDQVARSVAAISGHAADAKHLPIEAITQASDAPIAHLTIGAQRFCCDLRTLTCTADGAQPTAADLLVSPDGQYAVRTCEGNLWVQTLANGAAHALTTDGVPDAGYGIWPDCWAANYVPRLRSTTRPSPVEAYWAPNSRTVLVPFIDQRHVAPYPFVESAPVDGSFRPRVHPIRLALVGEQPASFEWFLIDVDTGLSRRVLLPYDRLLSLQQDITAFRDVTWSKDSRRLYFVAHGANMEAAYLFEVDVDSGTARTVLEERIAPRTDLNSTSYNPVNVRVVRDGREFIWFSQRDGWGHLCATRSDAAIRRCSDSRK